MAHIIEVDDSNFEQEVLESDVPVLVTLPWCGLCRMIAPVFEELAEEYGDKVKFAKINVDQATEVVDGQYHEHPHIMLFSDGDPVETIVVVQPKARYTELLMK